MKRTLSNILTTVVIAAACALLMLAHNRCADRPASEAPSALERDISAERRNAPDSARTRRPRKERPATPPPPPRSFLDEAVDTE